MDGDAGIPIHLLFVYGSGDNMEQNEQQLNQPSEKKRPRLHWSIILNAVLVVGVLGAVAALVLLHQSDTNPQFCATCHNMQNHVSSYLGSNHLDNIHATANVQCKECHDYPIPAEIASGIKFITGNYDKSMPQRKYDDSMCLQCHISYDYVASKTADLEKNPHNSHLGQMSCRTCHISHGEQIDYCAECHDNGGQTMAEDIAR